MKRIAVLLLACMLFMSCVPNSLYTVQRQFSRDDLAPISPAGLKYEDSIGTNWWSGSFNGQPVLIHAVVTSSYVNVNITFIPGGKVQ